MTLQRHAEAAGAVFAVGEQDGAVHDMGELMGEKVTTRVGADLDVAAERVRFPSNEHSLGADEDLSPLLTAVITDDDIRYSGYFAVVPGSFVASRDSNPRDVNLGGAGELRGDGRTGGEARQGGGCDESFHEPNVAFCNSVVKGVPRC